MIAHKTTVELIPTALAAWPHTSLTDRDGATIQSLEKLQKFVCFQRNGLYLGL